MAHLSALPLLLLAVSGACYGSSRIVGGTATTVERFPYIVQVENYNFCWEQFCGGSVLNERFVLSAAHCFESSIWSIPYDPSIRRIRAGATYRDTGGQIFYMIREYNHPNFRGTSTLEADITVIRLATFMRFTPVIQPVSLFRQGSVIPDNLPVTAVGWGDTEFEGLPSHALQYAEIYTINNELCRQRYQTLRRLVVSENMTCAGLLDIGGRDVCHGDSGGPLLFGDQGAQLGVVSWAYRCANDTLPGVHTSVPSFTDWIIATAV